MNRKDVSNIKINVQNETSVHFEHENSIAGAPPFLRGINSAMYLQNPIVFVKKVNSHTASESNYQLKKLVSEGHFNIAIAFNFKASKNITTDSINIHSIKDMKMVFSNIPLNKLHLTLETHGNNSQILSLFLATAKEFGFQEEDLSFAIQDNRLHSLNLDIEKNDFETIFNYALKNKKFKGIVIATPLFNTENKNIASTFNLALEYLKAGLSMDYSIDQIAPKIAISIVSHSNFVENIAQLRAFRLIWAMLIKQFNPQKPSTMALQIHSNSNNSNSHNSRILSAIFGGSQSAEIDATFDFFSQNYLLNETYISKTVDPWAGSLAIEKRTAAIYIETWNTLQSLHTFLK